MTCCADAKTDYSTVGYALADSRRPAVACLGVCALTMALSETTVTRQLCRILILRHRTLDSHSCVGFPPGLLCDNGPWLRKRLTKNYGHTMYTHDREVTRVILESNATVALGERAPISSPSRTL